MWGGGCGCGEVGVGVWMENPTPVQRLYRIILIQSVIFGHSCVVC